MKRTRSLHTKITGSFVTLFTCALLAFLLCTLPLVTRSLNAELEMASQQKVDILNNQINYALQDVRALWFSMVRDAQLQELLRNQEQWSDKKDLSLMLHNRINYRISPYAGIRSAIIIAPDSQVLDPIYGTAPYDDLLLQAGEYEQFRNSQLFGRFSSANTFPYNRPDPSPDEKNTITFMGDFFDTDTYESLGTIAINYVRSSLFDDIQPTLLEGFERVVLVDHDGQVTLDFHGQQSALPETVLHAESGEIVYDGDRYLAVFHKALPDYPSWSLYALLDYGTIRQPVYTLLVLISFIAFLVILSVALTSSHLSGQITRPLQSVVDAMKQVTTGKWQKAETINTGDELEVLIAGYNDMVTSLDTLTQRLVEEQNQKNKIRIAMLQSRLDMLQTQINPHFIHNTLNTMNYLALKENATELSRLIVSFNGLLRTSMSTQNMFCTVEEEVENIRRFIHIHQVRYDMDLVCEYFIAPEAEDIMIPKLILQPLVENSLFHGILPKGGGRITLKMAVADGRLWVELFDNGAGIPPDRLTQILSGSTKNPRGYSSIGLSNVFDRLVLTYGPASRPVIQSQENWGTIISFSIPQEKTDGDHFQGDDNNFDKS